MTRWMIAGLALAGLLAAEGVAAADCPDAHWKAGSRPPAEDAATPAADIPTPAIPDPPAAIGAEDGKAPPARADGAKPSLPSAAGAN
ncbi:MAG: hypothetical protein R3D02_01600 [Hyphomicrobiales bacterium]